MAENVEVVFREVEKRFINILTEMSRMKGRSPKFSIIAAYAFVREQFTQSLLQKITGYSRGTISKCLSKLVHDKVLEKQFDPDSRQYIYENKGKLRDILGGSTTNLKKYFETMIDKFKEVKKKINQEPLKMKKGYQNIEGFVSEMLVLIPAYMQLFEKFKL